MINRIEVPYTYRFADMVDRLDDGGLLLAATKRSGESNVMTIGWGTVGVVWGLPMFTVLVRPSRFTYQFIEDAGEFTVNVPSPDMRAFVDFCGTRSGRDVNKFAEFDTASRFDLPVFETVEPPGCRCGDVITGRCLPTDCPLFGQKCTPREPVGPCMVSSEGSCAAYYKYGVN